MNNTQNYLALDIGNTGAKAGLVNGGQEVGMPTQIESPGHLLQIFRQQNISKVGLSCVGPNADQWHQTAQQIAPVVNISANLELPVEVVIEQKYSIGSDRTAAVAGAHLLHPNTNRLIIDAGTCITYDVVNQQNQWLGGAISPGLQMRFDAMHQQTESLPQLSPQEEWPNLPAPNTKAALQAGAIAGMAYEIAGFCNEFGTQFENLNIIISGGHHKTFEKTLKQTIFVSPYLVLIGIGVLLKLNHA